MLCVSGRLPKDQRALARSYMGENDARMLCCVFPHLKGDILMQSKLLVHDEVVAPAFNRAWHEDDQLFDRMQAPNFRLARRNIQDPYMEGNEKADGLPYELPLIRLWPSGPSGAGFLDHAWEPMVKKIQKHRNCATSVICFW